jgi:hypothetical protein
MSSTVSALLLGITFSDLKRFFAVSRPFEPFERDRFNELHSFGTRKVDVAVGGSLGGIGWMSGCVAVCE